VTIFLKIKPEVVPASGTEMVLEAGNVNKEWLVPILVFIKFCKGI
jgi:hypothetical protein